MTSLIPILNKPPRVNQVSGSGRGLALYSFLDDLHTVERFYKIGK